MPLRFLNLLPLSHMFGQAMATFMPPMLPASSSSSRGYEPDEIVAQIRTRRISVLVSVPKILDVLREHIARGRARSRRDRRPEGRALAEAMVALPRASTGCSAEVLGFVVGAAPLDPELEAFWGRSGSSSIQGYGLTETAPIVTLNHPFQHEAGAVGKPIAGVEVRIADGRRDPRARRERHHAATSTRAEETAQRVRGRLVSHRRHRRGRRRRASCYIRGRKKEMIVTPEGLNVFPEDVERVLNALPGVRESAVVGERDRSARSACTPSWSLEPGVDVDAHRARGERRAARSPEDSTRAGLAGRRAAADGRHAQAEAARSREWVDEPARAPRPAAAGTRTRWPHSLRSSPAGRRSPPPTTHRRARVELARARGADGRARGSVSDDASTRRRLPARRDLGQLAHAASTPPPDRANAASRAGRLPVVESILAGPRRSAASACRPGSCRSARAVRLDDGRGPRAPRDLHGPVVFAANHQSHMDAPAILAALPARWRYRVAPAMAKEFFKAHFFPEQYGAAGLVHQQPQLLPGGALLQRVSAAAARGRGAADASIHRRAAGRRASPC